MQRDDIKMLVKRWWDIYNDESLDYNHTVAPRAARNRTRQVNRQPFQTALFTEAGDLNYFTAPSAA